MKNPLIDLQVRRNYDGTWTMRVLSDGPQRGVTDGYRSPQAALRWLADGLDLNYPAPDEHDARCEARPPILPLTDRDNCGCRNRRSHGPQPDQDKGEAWADVSRRL